MSDTYTEFKTGTYNPAEIQTRGFGMVQYGPGDDGLIVGFYRRSVLNTSKSEAAGKRICENRDFVKIQHPGESLNIVDRPVQDSDKQRWPRQWAQYSENRKQVPDGIPISLLFPSQPNISDMLVGYNIHTVEQLAHLSGHAIGTIGMGCQEWVNAAAKYLEQASKGVDFHRFDAERKAKDTEIAVLKQQVSDLTNQMTKFMSRAAKPVRHMPEPDYDIQTEIINNTMEAPSDNDPVTFSREMTMPDLSAEVGENVVSMRKQRADKGKPRGPRKQKGE